MIVMQVLGWIGTIVALAVAALTMLAVMLALVYAAVSPVIIEIEESMRSRKVKEASGRYALRHISGQKDGTR